MPGFSHSGNVISGTPAEKAPLHYGQPAPVEARWLFDLFASHDEATFARISGRQNLYFFLLRFLGFFIAFFVIAFRHGLSFQCARLKVAGCNDTLLEIHKRMTVIALRFMNRIHFLCDCIRNQDLRLHFRKLSKVSFRKAHSFSRNTVLFLKEGVTSFWISFQNLNHHYNYFAQNAR
jgi:hypothetical protein